MRRSKQILRDIEESLRMSTSPRVPKLMVSQYNPYYNSMAADINQSPALSVSQLANPRDKMAEISPLVVTSPPHAQLNESLGQSISQSPPIGGQMNSDMLHKKITDELNLLMEEIENRCNELQQTIKSLDRR